MSSVLFPLRKWSVPLEEYISGAQDEKELLCLQRWTMWTSEQHVVNDLTDGIWKIMLYCTSTRWINSRREFGATRGTQLHLTLFRRKTCAQQMQGQFSHTQFVNEPSTERQQQPISTHRLASHLIREKNRCVCDLLSYPRHNIAQYWYIHLTCLSVSIYRLGGLSGSRMPSLTLQRTSLGSPLYPLLDKLKAEFWGR